MAKTNSKKRKTDIVWGMKPGRVASPHLGVYIYKGHSTVDIHNNEQAELYKQLHGNYPMGWPQKKVLGAY